MAIPANVVNTVGITVKRLHIRHFYVRKNIVDEQFHVVWLWREPLLIFKGIFSNG